jgi:hypothetical protein
MDFRQDPDAQPYRGIRNNNPGNIEKGIAWQGAVGDDGTFIIFADDTWGLRAMAKDLTTKINSDGLTTITAIITQYAPPSENDTASYIAAVASDTGFGATDLLTADQPTLHALIRAIANHENGDAGSALVSDADIDTGIQMAGDPTTVFNAAAIAVSANPGISLAGVGVCAVLLWLLLRKRK